MTSNIQGGRDRLATKAADPVERSESDWQIVLPPVMHRSRIISDTQCRRRAMYLQYYDGREARYSCVQRAVSGQCRLLVRSVVRSWRSPRTADCARRGSILIRVLHCCFLVFHSVMLYYDIS